MESSRAKPIRESFKRVNVVEDGEVILPPKGTVGLEVIAKQLYYRDDQNNLTGPLSSATGGGVQIFY